jgi:hypothetical protein
VISFRWLFGTERDGRENMDRNVAVSLLLEKEGKRLQNTTKLLSRRSELCLQKQCSGWE